MTNNDTDNGYSDSTAAIDIRFPYRDTVTDFARRTISHQICSAEKELRTFDTQIQMLNAEISRLEGVVTKLEGQREAVDKEIMNYRSLLSPIHRMPPEVMVEIFRFCCSFSNLHPYGFGAPPPPLELSSVCGRWHELVLNTPTLWTSLSAYNSSSYPNTRVYHTAKLFMDRSNSAPLAVNVQYHGPPDHRPDFFEPLVQNSRRWVRLELSTVPAAFEAQIYNRLRGELPLLKYLVLRDSISVEHSGSPVGEAPFLGAFQLAPPLRSVTLIGRLATPRLALPWKQIKNIRIQSCTVDRLLPILAQCLTVEEMKLQWITSGSPHTRSPITLPRVKQLSIDTSMAKHGPLNSIVGDLTLPGLQIMELRNVGSTRIRLSWDGTSTLRDFFIRSSCPLTSLYLRHLPMNDESLLSLLPLIPTLATLMIADASENRASSTGMARKTITNHLFSRFSLSYQEPAVEGFIAESCSKPSADVLVPRLKDLTLVVVDSEGLDERTMVNSLVSRLADTNRVLLGAQGAPRRAVESCLHSIDITLTVKDGRSFDTLRSLAQYFSGAVIKVRTAGHDRIVLARARGP
ncbi:hypothetical protein PQX77_016687 [Marasmius sp. AFHP31]|nr:hypothetical protein PQX77_016687 [Marasmius sp. AFHP31]